jgi:hypothetical protein
VGFLGGNMNTTFSTLHQQVIDFYNLKPEQINFINEMDKVYLVVFKKGLKKRPKFYSKKINAITPDDIFKTIEFTQNINNFIDFCTRGNPMGDFLFYPDNYGITENRPMIDEGDDFFYEFDTTGFIAGIMDVNNHNKNSGLENKKIILDKIEDLKTQAKFLGKYLNYSFEEITKLTYVDLRDLKEKTLENLEKQILINLKDTTFPIAISAKKKVNQFLGLCETFNTLSDMAEYILDKPEVLQMEIFYIYLKAGQTYREIYDN